MIRAICEVIGIGCVAALLQTGCGGESDDLLGKWTLSVTTVDDRCAGLSAMGDGHLAIVELPDSDAQEVTGEVASVGVRAIGREGVFVGVTRPFADYQIDEIIEMQRSGAGITGSFRATMTVVDRPGPQCAMHAIFTGAAE